MMTHSAIIKKFAYNCWYKRRWNFAHEQILPVHVAEESLLLDVLCVPVGGTQALLRGLPQQLNEEIN